MIEQEKIEAQIVHIVLKRENGKNNMRELKYISRNRKFKRIIKLAEEVWKGFFCG